ncbi:hypothetical protein G4B88_018588 [Cannabis sativa]|uniref:t-SNARE coiled-coil homology domain-containing protein n=1 Tax=Cannabis sativa TaxID=3483 RepID=A0A7J6HI92_CANSA|nr:hypothetical protein G4B88_018588 [Cannabis sativa]
MNDLLTDSFVSDAKGQPSGENDIEMGRQVQRNNADIGMETFNKQIQEVEKLVDKLSELLKKLKDANEDSKSVTKASAMKAIKKRMEKEIDEVLQIARNVKGKLELINKDNLFNRQKPGCEKGTGVDRARMNMTNALTKKFRDIMSEFQTLRQRIQDEYREVVERRVMTVTGTRPDEETIDNLIETGNSEEIFQKAIQESGRGQVLNTLEEIQERHHTVKEIERKLLDLHQVYIDMAVLVEAQGADIDNIENQVRNAVDHLQRGNSALKNAKKLQKKPITLRLAQVLPVTNAVDHVRSGTEALQTAKSLQKRSRKCMIIAIILLLVIAIIIVLSILKPWSK